MRFAFDEVAAMWEEADRLGFRSVWLSDHFTSTGVADARAPFDSWTALGRLAPLAPSSRVGVLVSAVTLRPPVPWTLNRVVETAFRFIGRRLVVGLGAGWCRREHEFCGIPFPPTGERIRLLARQADSLRLHFTANGGASRPAILIGGLGDRTLETAARHADIWNGIASPKLLEERRRRLERLCLERGRPPGAVQVSATVRTHVAEGRGQRQRAVRALASRQGFSIPEIRRRVAVGSVEQLAERTRRYLAAGADHVIFQPVASHPSGVDACLDQLRALAEVAARLDASHPDPARVAPWTACLSAPPGRGGGPD